MNTSNIRHECFLFAQKMMEMSDQKLMISFDVFDPSEMATDMEGKVTIEEQAEAENVSEETIRDYKLKAKVKRLKEMGYKITKEGE